MIPASYPLLKAMGTRLDAAFASESITLPWLVNPKPGRDLPYGVLIQGTETDGFSTKNTEGSICTRTCRIYTNDHALAERYAQVAIGAITDRTTTLTILAEAGREFYVAGDVDLEMNEIIRETDERGEIFGAAFRFRFLVGQREAA